MSALGVVRFIGKNKKGSELTAELYRLRNDNFVGKKIIELHRAVNFALTCGLRKNPLHVAAGELKKIFHLGDFIIYAGEKDGFSPIMSSGINLRSIKGVKVPALESRKRNRLTPPDALPSIKLADIERLPAGLDADFAFAYPVANRYLLFVGQDRAGEFARCCSFDEFNKEIWPAIVSLADSAAAFKKNLSRVRELESADNENRRRIEKLTSQKPPRPDASRMIEFTKQIFSIFDEQRLLEIIAGYLKTTFAARSVVILTKNDSGGYSVAVMQGEGDRPIDKLELSPDSEVIKLLADSDGAIQIKNSRFIADSREMVQNEKADGSAIVDKLTKKGDMSHILILNVSERARTGNENDLATLSIMSNLVSLALGNIDQYRLIEKMSYTDSMTGLYNYRYFYKRLNEEIYRARRFNRMLSLVIFDVDNFKIINDSFGHQAGDEVLKGLASLVISSVRAIDVVSRYGGEEFCIIMPETDSSSCRIFMERLRSKIQNQKFVGDDRRKGYEISVSIGGAIFPQDAQSADRLIYCADMALLKAKASGRNRSVMFGADMLEDNSDENQNKDNIAYET